MPISMNDMASAMAALGPASFEKLQIIEATALASQYYPHVDPNAALVVLSIPDPASAGRLRDVLLQVYPPEHAIKSLVVGTGTHTLSDLGNSAAFAPHILVPPLRSPASFEALQDVVVRLRAPDGCPWDRALTWDKLRPFLLEESYELLDALDAADATKVKEEQGDLLLQVALQAEIATEEGEFRFPDVIAHIVDKLIRRHPHVFGETQVSGTDEVLANWEAIKAEERAKTGLKRSPLAGVPAGLPALAQAESYLDRMSRLRTSPAPAEPWAPLAGLPPDAPLTPELLGQVMLDMVAWAMARGVESESALRAANARFAQQVAAEDWG